MRTTVGIVLIDTSGRVLMQLRDDRPDITDPGVWTVPGGGLEDGESLDEAARREFLEETGYHVDKLLPVYADSIVASDGSKQERHFFVSTYDGVQPVGCFEGQEITFLASEEREGLRTTPDLMHIIDRALIAVGSAS